MEFGYLQSLLTCFRVAMKKSGPAINSFLKKMEQQMGVAMVGFATYRDDEGKLRTFEYVAPLPPGPTLLTKANPHTDSVLMMTGRPASPKQIIRMLKGSLENGGNGLQKRVRLTGFYSLYSLTYYIDSRSWEHPAK